MSWIRGGIGGEQQLRTPTLIAPDAPLWISGQMACYQGRTVELNEVEYAAASKVVIQAIARTLDEQLVAVRALLPARGKRKPAATAPSVPGNEPRKRGRPKKTT